MEEDVHVTAGETEGDRDVLAVALLEQAHHHDRALRLAEAVYAGAEANVVFRLRDQALGRRRAVLRLDRLELVVGAREVMAPTLVSRGVDDDAGEKGPVLGSLSRELAALSQLQERTKGVVYAIERVLGAEAFPTCQTHQGNTLLANHAVERAQHVFFRIGVHLGLKGVQPGRSYAM